MDYSLIFGFVASVNVLLGGLLVLKLKNYFDNILGFAGGVMLAVIFFKIIPEMLHLHEELNFSLTLGMGTILFGLLFFHLLTFFIPLHESGHHETESSIKQADPQINQSPKGNHLDPRLGVWGVSAMIVHSFIDGFGIGLAFQLSPNLGIMVAIAVIAHNFSDGINSMTTLLHSTVDKTKTQFLFLLNILAPLAGVFLSKIIQVNEFFVYIYLGLFSGTILYLAVSEILPHAHSKKPNLIPIIFTLLGVLLIVGLTQLIQVELH